MIYYNEFFTCVNLLKMLYYVGNEFKINKMVSS